MLKFLIVPVLVYLFRFELGLTWQLYRFVILDDLTVVLPPTREWSFQIIFFGGGVLVALAAAFLLMYVISGSIYPLNFSRDRYEVIFRLLNFFFGAKRPVIWVREGRQQLGVAGVKDYGGGVALIDPNSAVVLEDSKKGQRVRSGGVVFIGAREKFVGAVSLRRQSRSISNIKVQTSDGIELTTSVSVTFTLGEEPEVKKVAYVGNLPFGHDHKHLDLRVIKLKWDSPQGGNIAAISDELDLSDKLEIHAFVKEYRKQASNRTVPLAPDDDSRRFPPFFLEDSRVAAAAMARARRANNEGTDQWTDFPAAAAVEKLRNQIAAYRYDQLYYSPKEFDEFASVGKLPGDYPLVKHIRPNFANEIKYLGVMSYQYIFPLTGQPIEENLRVDRRTFRFAPVQPLSNTKILRSLGIKVRGAGFGDLVPSPEIREQRLAHWLANWQEVTEHQAARAQARAERIKNEARSRRYFEMLRKMYDILDSKNKSSGDVLIESILQTLKEIADDPDTRRGLPDETILLMKTLQSRLLPPPKS